MIHMYNEVYLDEAKESLGIVIDYLAYYCKFSNKQIETTLINSKVLKQFLYGNPGYIAGKSGTELAELVASEVMDISTLERYEDTFEKTPEYWTGWILAEFCWYTCNDFSDVFYSLSYEDILRMYHPYHEMDTMHFIEDLYKRIRDNVEKTNLRIIREINELSQSQLAKKSGVSLRSIQLYEQRVNNIDKAQVHSLYKLAKALHCKIEDLLDEPMKEYDFAKGTKNHFANKINLKGH